MSDVMKQVVQEIMQGNKTIVSNKSKNPITEAGSDLKNIKRPNYQRLKRDERLLFTQKNASTSSTNSERPERKQSATRLPKQFNEESIAALHSMSLVQGNVPRKERTRSYENKSVTTKARIIGKTRNGGCVWFFPELSKELKDSFERPLNRAAVGVVKMPKCLPSYLLLMDEVIRNNEEIKFNVAWTKDAGTSFTAELYDDDIDRLDKIMNDLYQKLNRHSFKQYETYTALSPSQWLASQMNISKSAEGIAILEGVSYYTSIVLMDSLLKNVDTRDFKYEINSNYLLLHGNFQVISKLIAELKKEAAGLINSDIS